MPATLRLRENNLADRSLHSRIMESHPEYPRQDDETNGNGRNRGRFYGNLDTPDRSNTLPPLASLFKSFDFRCRRCNASYEHVVHLEKHEQVCLAFQPPGSASTSGSSMNPADARDSPTRDPNKEQTRFSDDASSLTSDGAPQWPSVPAKRQWGSPSSFGSHSRQSSQANMMNQDQMQWTPPAHEDAPSDSEAWRWVVVDDRGRGGKRSKQQKEKDSRAAQSRMMQTIEDLVENYLGYTAGHSLSSGNANAAGHAMGKIDLHLVQVGLIKSHLHEGYTRALRAGRLEQWQEAERQIIERQYHAPNLVSDSWLDGGHGARPCTYDRRSKRCLTHANPDHRKCRKDRLRENFRRNLDRYQAAHRAHAEPAIADGERSVPLRRG